MGLKPENPLVGGTVLRRAAIESPNYATDTSGWAVKQDGSAEFNNADIRGNLISADNFTYNGTPAAGNPPIASICKPGTTQDPFGNPVIENAITTYNVYGAVINCLSMANSAFFQYQDKGSAVQGSVILSVSSTGGNDPVTGFSYDPGVFGYDPVFGDSILITGARVQFGQILWTQKAQIEANGGNMGDSPYLALFAPEQGQSGHLVLMMQGTSPDGSHLGQFLIGREGTGTSPLTPVTSSLIEFQSDVSGLIDPLISLIMQAASDKTIGIRQKTDTVNRLRVLGDGTLRWTDGSDGRPIHTVLPPSGDSSGADDVANLNSALAIGSVECLRGPWYLNAPVDIPAGSRLIAHGAQFQPVNAIGQMFALNGDDCGIVGASFYGGSAVRSANPAADAILVNPGIVRWRIIDVTATYVNGMIVPGLNLTAATHGIIDKILGYHNGGGIKFTSGVGGLSIQVNCGNLDIQQCETDPAFYLIDVYDVLVSKLNAAVLGSSAIATMHIQGACATCEFNNLDIGVDGTPTAGTPVLKIDNGGGANSPNDLTFSHGTIQAGGIGVLVSNLSQRLRFTGIMSKNNQGDGWKFDGTGTAIALASCAGYINNQAGGTAYDAEITSTAHVGLFGFAYCSSGVTDGLIVPATNHVTNSNPTYPGGHGVTGVPSGW